MENYPGRGVLLMRSSNFQGHGSLILLSPCFTFVSSKLIPAKHVSTVQKDKVILTYAIVSGFKFIVVTVIQNSIS